MPANSNEIADENEYRAWIRLGLEPRLGPVRIRTLLATIGLPQDIYAQSTSALSKLLGPELAAQLRQAPDDSMAATIEATMAWLNEPAHHLLTLADKHYPTNLLALHDPPALLYLNGNPDCLHRPILSIVGARSATTGGRENAQAFARYLAGQGWCIASGLASGIDGAAHEGALQAGPEAGGTIAVLGTGIDLVYPARHRQLAHRIASSGLLVSEFPLGAHAQPFHFPQRNRVVAALGRGVLVVEAAQRSGSLITAQQASEIGREIFAIPGSIHSPLSRGCHALIRQGAKLVESGEDIMEELRQSGLIPQSAHQPNRVDTPTQTTESLSADEHTLLQALGHDPQSTEVLHARTQWDMARLHSTLALLELQGRIARQADSRFQRLG
ncbi:DNA-processing protein DprA [Alcaligenaceae bacterium CGII-47]|nr:DNA-processing protein DprA [Alcaligenaceae bacterium CGII-47]